MSSQLTAKQVDRALNLTGDSFQRELKKLAKIDPRLECKNGEFAIDVLESILSELESDLAIENDQNNLDQVNDQAIVESALAVESNEPVGTGKAGHTGTELFFWPEFDRYCVSPYNKDFSITKEDWAKFSIHFHTVKLIDTKAVKAELKKQIPTVKYNATVSVTYEIETKFDLSDYTFTKQSDLKAFLRYHEIPYTVNKVEQFGFTKFGDGGNKKPHSQRSVGSTGSTKGGLSDPFDRPDPSIPVESDRIKAVKRGSSAHLALLALEQGINVKDKSESAIASLQSLADTNQCEMINPSQFSWKFRQVSLMNGYGYELIAPNTYQLVLPEGLTEIKVK
jgi:hypothetical protein